MKRYKIIGLAGAVLGYSILATAVAENPARSASAGPRAASNETVRRGIATNATASLVTGSNGVITNRFRNHRNRNQNNQGSVVVIYPSNDSNSQFPPGYRINARSDDYPNGYGRTSLEQPDPVTLASPSQATAPQVAQTPESPDFVVAVQRELRRRGFYSGAINGTSDAGTRAAIRSYEASAGLPVTGIIGTQLLRSLGFLN